MKKILAGRAARSFAIHRARHPEKNREIEPSQQIMTFSGSVEIQ